MPAQTRIIHYYVCLGAAGGKEWKVNMKKILDLNIYICIVVTFLFEFLDGSNMIPSQYRLAIAAIILIFDAIFAIYAIIESRKKNHSIKMFLDKAPHLQMGGDYSLIYYV